MTKGKTYTDVRFLCCETVSLDEGFEVESSRGEMPINGFVLEIIMFQRQEKKYINMYIYI